MPGLVPGIHVFFELNWKKQDVDGRVKPGHDEMGVFRRMAATSPACFPALLAPNKDREIGGGRATRQPGQVRKEAALTSKMRVVRWSLICSR